MPMCAAPLEFSGSDFTTSPTSTATNGIHNTPFSDSHNPFDASFAQTAYPDNHQQLPYKIHGSQCSLQSPGSQLSSPHSAFPSEAVQLNTDYLYAPQPKRCNGDIVGELQQGAPVEALETCAVSLTQPRKRRRTAHEPNGEAGTIPTATKLPTRRKTLPSTASDSRPAAGNSAIDKERHKHVEMKYRKQMKDRYEQLLLALPVQVASINTNGKSEIVFQKNIRRGKVLDLAKEHIDLLEREKDKLEWERQILQREVKVYEDVWFGNMGMPGPMVPLS
ncbi:uncharacterized protein PAC_01867 [Phialocephala subalpina]|uniref:Uncharacterized protein n=1 Tax=Phialocephala subalpina TaxID=576137 RepID=A0A1L7WGT2_9HELO|nr:uncharacterized protein PAC_01867 [Phialocephala subalpina]